MAMVTRAEFEGIREEVASLRRRLVGAAADAADPPAADGSENPLHDRWPFAEDKSTDVEGQKLGAATAVGLG